MSRSNGRCTRTGRRSTPARCSSRCCSRRRCPGSCRSRSPDTRSGSRGTCCSWRSSRRKGAPFRLDRPTIDRRAVACVPGRCSGRSARRRRARRAARVAVAAAAAVRARRLERLTARGAVLGRESLRTAARDHQPHDQPDWPTSSHRAPARERSSVERKWCGRGVNRESAALRTVLSCTGARTD
jgi:hypothetical protein